jgi:hypothetical protein
MPRQLSKAEQEYIVNHSKDLTAAEIASDMPGVGAKTIQKFIDESVLEDQRSDETQQQRQATLQKKTKLTAGKLMGRDPSRGITVMTEAASELSDSRRPVHQKTAIRSERIHVIDKNRKSP